MASNKDNSEVKLINSVAGTGALSTQSLFNIKGWVTVGMPSSHHIIRVEADMKLPEGEPD
jgi:hypothetical protein